MAEVTTVLAHLVPKLTSQVENAATDALAFILNRSTDCLRALDRLLQEGEFNPGPIVSVDTQVTYVDGSRPDMAGYDGRNVKRLLVEAKFWAPLLRGQASGYVHQFEATGPGVLLFIAPDSRLPTLWADIRRQMETEGPTLQLGLIETTGGIRRAEIRGSEKQVMLVSWDQLLGRMDDAAAGDTGVACDIQQLRGLVRYQDEEAFQPIHPAEFGLTLPRRMRGLNCLIDDVRSREVKEGWISAEGLAAAPQRQGYGRYLRFRQGSHGIIIPGDLFLCVHYRRWAVTAPCGSGSTRKFRSTPQECVTGCLW